MSLRVIPGRKIILGVILITPDFKSRFIASPTLTLYVSLLPPIEL
jgi:hypothetical protein